MSKFSSRESVFVGLFGKIMGLKLFNWLNPCCDTFCPDVLACLTAGSVGVCTDDTLSGDGTLGNCLSVVPAPALSGGGMFFGLTAGTGNGGPTDYAATVAVTTSVGTGRVPFPQDGPGAASAATRVDASSFTLAAVGTYEVIFSVHTTEAGQLQVELNGLGVPNTTTPDMNPTSGGHLIVGHSIVTTSVPNEVLAIINPPGNSSALTITPADGAQTHANAQRLIIRRIA